MTIFTVREHPRDKPEEARVVALCPNENDANNIAADLSTDGYVAFVTSSKLPLGVTTLVFKNLIEP